MEREALEVINKKADLALTSSLVGKAVYEAIRECATTLRADCFCAIQDFYNEALAKDPSARETVVMQNILHNANIGSEKGMPICQDTGSVWIELEVGEENNLPGNIFSEVNQAVERAYIDGRLRMSLVEDALFDRRNTQNNTPAFTEVTFVPGRAVRLHVMLKGGGSDNASRLIMLAPSAGKEGIKREVLSLIREKAANACPPLLVGIGVGATFDKVASLSKHALMRRIGTPAENEEARAFEQELLSAINATGIGPAALGGFPTALAVHIASAPCHIAALPLAINLGCCALRSATIELVDEDGITLAHPLSETWEYIQQ